MNNSTKENVKFLAAIVITLSLIAAVIIFAIPVIKKYIASATVQYHTHRPSPGVECLVVNSSDGVATSCYYIETVQIDNNIIE